MDVNVQASFIGKSSALVNRQKLRAGSIARIKAANSLEAKRSGKGKVKGTKSPVPDAVRSRKTL